jgi:hypothetical protein
VLQRLLLVGLDDRFGDHSVTNPLYEVSASTLPNCSSTIYLGIIFSPHSDQDVAIKII